MGPVVGRIALLLLLMVHSGSHAYPWGAPESSCEDGFIPGVMVFLMVFHSGQFIPLSLSLSLLSIEISTASSPMHSPQIFATFPFSFLFLPGDAISLQVHTGFFPKGFRRLVHGECARCFAPHTAYA
jgi:hypothetical protein